MNRKLVLAMALLATSALASGYSWDGTSWADPTPFLSPITQDVKDTCRAIMLSSAGSGRVAGRMGQIGDSITNSQAYFGGSSMGGGTGTNETGHDFGPIMGWLSPAVTENGHSYPAAPNWNCWYRNPHADIAGSVDDWRKGAVWCNYSGWRVSNAVSNGHPATVVGHMNCSWAVIMYGTNDQDGWSSSGLEAASQSWKTNYKAFAQDFIDLGVIPVLSTIPPEHDHIGDQRYLLANERIKEICSELSIPYIDYYAYILHHQPGDAWDGELHGEHRLISTDGTHPSNVTSNFSQTALTVNGGYRARTFLTFAMAEKVKEIIFDNGAAETADFTITTASPLPSSFLNVAYSSVSLATMNGTGSVTWSIQSGSLPSGMSLSSAGVISGTPTEAGTFNFTVLATDSATPTAQTDTKAFELTIISGATLNPVQDTWADQTAPSANNGTATTFRVDGQNDPNAARQYTGLLKFDLAGAGIDASATVTSATLRLYATYVRNPSDRGCTTLILPVKSAWTETGATQTSTGTGDWVSSDLDHGVSLDYTALTIGEGSNLGASVAKATRNPGTDWTNTWVEFDVTSLVGDWAAGTLFNNGMAIYQVSRISGSAYGGYTEIDFASREHATNPPELVIQYSGGGSTYSISGTVSGDVAQGVTITLGGSATATTTTDASGNYTFAGLIDGTYTITPSLAGYTFSPTSLSGIAVSGANVTGQNFTSAAIPTYTITASAGTGGSISPSGAVVVNQNANQSFTITANSGYVISDVLVDGSSVGAVASYTFTNVTANHTIAASFVAIPTYTISGTVSGDVAAGVTITLGGSATATTTTDASGNYTFAELIDGTYTITPSLAGYTFSPTSLSGVAVSGANVTGQNFTSAAIPTYTITATAGAGGSVSPSGLVDVNENANQSFTIAANSGYVIADVLVDGSSVGAVASYTFTNVTADHTIAASFVEGGGGLTSSGGGCAADGSGGLPGGLVMIFASLALVLRRHLETAGE